MTLTSEQVRELKNQLFTQIQNLPEEQRELARQQIESMSPQALESMLHQQQTSGSEKNIFRMIIDKEVDSVVVGENSGALAILDINPISEGHALIIPKSPAKTNAEVAQEAHSLAKEVTERLKSNLNAKEVEMQLDTKFGETIIHLIPIYDKPLTLTSPRQKSSPDTLKEIAKKINTIVEKIEKPKPIKIKQYSAPKEIIKGTRRIP
ncbi:HIT family protein [Candidatus Pacearchaeota archaeon]|nr:HIT family protein [Candidatus Pacearchaeota archaeon]